MSSLDKNLQHKLRVQPFLDSLKLSRNEGGLRAKYCSKKQYKRKPLISVVTVVFNGEKYLEQTINSVVNQSYNNIEYIVIDGGSTDGTVDIIKRHEHAIDYWLSEPDEGIYNAMNKGANLCTGEYIAFLNADDWYNLDTVESVVQRITKGTDFLFGNILMYRSSTDYIEFKSNLANYKKYMPFGHPSLFLKRDLALELGFDEQYRTIADYDLVLRLIEGEYQYTYIDEPLANYRVGGASSFDLYGEHFRLYCNHFGLVVATWHIVLRLYDKSFMRLKKFIKKLVQFKCTEKITR
ncbi:MAG: glycosyltransferase family 2 protein [Cycloclasticus sp.]|nr:glycosyltransferase family 2 protein [Cycloclasticus sp.]